MESYGYFMKNISKINFIVRPLALITLALQATYLVAAPYGQGPNPYSPPAHLSLREQAAATPLGITLDVATGIGRYQDIQAPLASNGLGIGRVDGSTTRLDSSSHTAPLLSARLGWAADSEYGRQFVGFGGTRMSALSSNDPNAAGTSYARLGLDGGADWTVGDGLSVLSAVELRRSMYRNTDSGHYIDAVMLRAGLTQRFDRYSLGAAIAAAPITQFGYMQRSGTSGGLQSTSSSLYEWSAQAAWAPMSDAKIFAGVSQELVSADMSHVRAYRNLGLNVADDDADTTTDRHYRLATTSFTIGASRRF